MPSYYARSTAIQLSTAPLATTSSTNASTIQSHETSSAIQSINTVFSKASLFQTLNEESIQDTEVGSHIHFLGKDKNIPFMIVHAGKQVTAAPSHGQVVGPGLRGTARPRRVIDAATTPETGLELNAYAPTSYTPTPSSGIGSGMITRRISQNRAAIASSSSSSNINGSVTPVAALNLEALSLNVLLSPQSFITATPFGAPNKKMDTQDLQILVYMNGTFAMSSFVPARYATEEFLTSKLSVRFTGHRLGRLVEKPWVLGPPQAQQSIENGASGVRRWSEISQLLLKEVNYTGKSKTGDSPISGELLSHLASMACPEAVKGMGKFGCMDVFVMTGKGGKHVVGGRYSTGPERMTDRLFQPQTGGTPETPHTLSSATTPLEFHDVDTDDASMGGDGSEDRKDLSPYNLRTPRKRRHTPDPSTNKRKPPQTPNQATIPASDVTDDMQVSNLHRDVDMLTLSESTAVSRRQLPQTPVGEISPLSSLATEDLDALAQESSASQTDVTTNADGSRRLPANAKILQSSPESSRGPLSKSRLRPSPGGTLSSVQTRSGRQLLKLRPPKPPAKTALETPQPASAKATTKKQTRLPKTPSANALGNSLSQQSKSKTPATPITPTTPTTPTTPSTPLDGHFQVPAASQDCVLGFAPAGVVRNVPAIRGGWFRETGVVYGCRFILT